MSLLPEVPVDPNWFTYWVVSPLKQVFRDTRGPIEGENGDETRIFRLVGARRETVTAQFVLRCDGEAYSVKIEPGALERMEEIGTIPPQVWEFHWVDYFRQDRNSKATPPEELIRTAPALYPDALVKSEMGKVPVGENQPVYVLLRIPEDAEPGIYKGMVTIRAFTEKGILTYPLPVELEVLPLELPERTRLLVTLWVNLRALAYAYGTEMWTEKFWDILFVHARDMAQHHQNVILTPLETIRVSKDADNKLHFDFSALERWINVFTDAGVLKPPGRLEFFHFGARRDQADWEGPFVFRKFTAYLIDQAGNPTGETTDITTLDVVEPLVSFLKEKKLSNRTIFHIADEPVKENMDSWKDISRQIHAIAPEVKRMDAITTSELRGYLDVWVPRLNLFERTFRDLSDMQKTGEIELWHYTCWAPQDNYPNRLMDYPLIKTRLLHWINFLYGATGFLHWGYNYWATPFYKHSPGDNWIVWPGDDNGPRSSLRYEAMRQGIEDYEFLMMLVDSTRKANRALAKQAGIEYVDKKETYAGGNGEPIDDLWDPRLRAVELAGQVLRTITDYTWNDDSLLNVRETIQREIVQMELGPLAIVRTTPGTNESFDENRKIVIEGYVENGTVIEQMGEPSEGDCSIAVQVDHTGFFKTSATIGTSNEIVLRISKGGQSKEIRRSWQNTTRRTEEAAFRDKLKAWAEGK
jgi:hypothetical protein